jgi:hypothetical protein
MAFVIIATGAVIKILMGQGPGGGAKASFMQSV